MILYILLHVCGDPHKIPCPMVGDSKRLGVCLPLRAGTTYLCGRTRADAHGMYRFLGKLYRASVMPGRYRLNQNTFPPTLNHHHPPPKSSLVLMAKSQFLVLPSLSIVILPVRLKTALIEKVILGSIGYSCMTAPCLSFLFWKWRRNGEEE